MILDRLLIIDELLGLPINELDFLITDKELDLKLEGLHTDFYSNSKLLIKEL